jgi:hypothetical protein
MKRALLSTLLLSLLCFAAVAADTPFGWANALRGRAGSPSVEADSLLSKTAAAWAGALAAAGALSHRGSDGSSALDRYQRLGGTEVRVGEILGAGPDLAAVEAAWEKSPNHLPLVLKPYWTHMGWGSASGGRAAGDAIVFVVLFCQKLVDGLLIEERDGAVELRGSFVPPDARLPVLLAGIREVAPASWDASARRFLFRVSRAEAGYLRLGYAGGEGDLEVTNAIRPPAIASPAAAPPDLTSPPGTVSPEAPGRFAEPAAPP